jgi:hypothetical protein
VAVEGSLEAVGERRGYICGDCNRTKNFEIELERRVGDQAGTKPSRLQTRDHRAEPAE